VGGSGGRPLTGGGLPSPPFLEPLLPNEGRKMGRKQIGVWNMKILEVRHATALQLGYDDLQFSNYFILSTTVAEPMVMITNCS